MQQGYEWCLLSFNVGLDIAGVYVFPAFGDVIGMNEILGCQIFTFFCTFRARFSSFQEQAIPYKRCTEGYAGNCCDLIVFLDIADYKVPYRSPVKSFEFILYSHFPDFRHAKIVKYSVSWARITMYYDKEITIDYILSSYAHLQ